MSKKLSERRLENALNNQLVFKKTGVSLESDNVDPTVTLVEAKAGSLFMSKLTGKLYQKQTDLLDLDWVEIPNLNDIPSGGGAVDSVNGQTGVVVLDKDDIGLGNVPNVDATLRSNHTGTQLASTISDFTSAARTASVADAITDGVTNIAPSQNAVFDALSLKADQTSLNAHINDTSDAHDASAISVIAQNGITSTDVQSALEELQSEIAAIIPGEVNTASNVGTGSDVFKQKVGVDLQFRTLIAGSNITLTENADDITIAASGSSGANVTLTNLSGFTDGSIPYASASGTALTQDNDNLFWDATNKRLGLGINTPARTLSIRGESSGTSDGVLIQNFNSSTTSGPGLALNRARGTIASPTAIQTGDVTGTISTNAHNGSSFHSTSPASISFVASENQTITAAGSRIAFNTTGNGTLTRKTRFAIDQDGAAQLYGDTSGILRLKPAATTTTHTLNLPAAQGGVGTFLQNDGAGNLSWAAAGSSGASTALDNLTSPTNINQTLRPNANNTRDIGEPNRAFRRTHTQFIYDSTGQIAQFIDARDFRDVNGQTAIDMADSQNILVLPSGTAGVVRRFQFFPISGAGSVSLYIPNNVASAINFVLPNTNGTAGQRLTTNGSGVTSWTNRTIIESGNTASRPVSPVTGETFLDLTINKPIWYNGVDWIDATGAIV